MLFVNFRLAKNGLALGGSSGGVSISRAPLMNITLK